MSFKIEQGLFSLDFTDYHAILGVPVDADPKDIRKQYLKIARRLHPDSSANEKESERQRAAEYLSKLVNPAYEKLSQEKSYTDYCILLKLKGQQAQRQQETVILTSEPARRLAASSDVEPAYKAAVRQLSDKLYEHLDKTLELIGQLSELNLVYLMRSVGKVEQNRKPLGSTATPQPGMSTPPPRRQPGANELFEAAVRRAKEFEAKGDYNNAIRELRDAVKLAPSRSESHSLLGVIYLKTNQLTMAKIHFNKAVELNPNDETAQAGLSRLEGNGTGKTGAKASKQPDKKSAPPKGDNSDKSGGGLFGLFGGKKK